MKSAISAAICLLTIIPAASGQQPPCDAPPLPTSMFPSSEEPPLAVGEETSEPPSEPTPEIVPASNVQPQPRQVGTLPGTPMVRIRVRAPAVAPNGQELVYRFELTNPSDATAYRVRVRADKPEHTTFVTADPPVSEQTDKEMFWDLGTMPANSRREIRLTLEPQPDAGQVKLCARVSFEHGQCVVTRLSKPAVELVREAAREAVLFEPIDCEILVRNNGQVPVGDVQVIEALGDGLDFEELLTPERRGQTPATPHTTTEDGRTRTWTVGTLAPGQSRTIRYRLFPKKVGEVSAKTVVTGDGVTQEKTSAVTVLEPKLSIEITGPKEAHVASPTEYKIHIRNAGTAPLNNVRVTGAMPAGAKAVKVSNGGQLFPGEVQWILTRLEPEEERSLTLGVNASQPGSRPVSVAVRADRGLEQNSRIETLFLGVAALDFSAVGSPSTAQPGDVVRYTVEVVNTGSAPATNVVLTATLPTSMKYVDAGPEELNPRFGDGVLVFGPRTIEPGLKAVYTIRSEALRADQAKFRFELKADHLDKSKPALSKEPAVTVGGP